MLKCQYAASEAIYHRCSIWYIWYSTQNRQARNQYFWIANHGAESCWSSCLLQKRKSVRPTHESWVETDAESRHEPKARRGLRLPHIHLAGGSSEPLMAEAKSRPIDKWIITFLFIQCYLFLILATEGILGICICLYSCNFSLHC